MCRMLAVVSRKPVPADTLLAFRQLADTGRNFRDFGCPQPNPKSGHPDGWGIACVAQEGEFYARSPVKATADPRYEEAVRQMVRTCSPPLVLVAHLRYASKRDTIQERYCHPFRREVDGRGVFFAHNGEITDFGVKVESYTFLLLDGNRLIAHRDARTCVPYYTLHETGTEDMRVVCSEVLPTLPGRWRMLRNGESVEFRP